MGRNIGGKIDTKGCELLYLKLTGLKENETPTFTVQKKKGTKYESDVPTNNVCGDLKKIEWEEYTYDTKKGLSCSVHLCDTKANEYYVIQMGFSFTMRGIINSLLSLEGTDLKDVYIGVYRSKKTGNVGTDVRTGGASGEPANWKHDYKEVLAPLVERITKKDGQVINDYGDLDDFFKSEIDRFNEDYIERYWGNTLTGGNNKENRTQADINADAKELERSMEKAEAPKQESQRIIKDDDLPF